MPWSTNLITDGVVTTEQVNAITDGSDTGAISGLNLELTALGVITLRAGSGRYRTGGEFVTLTLPSDTILTPPTTVGLYLVTVRDNGDGETLEVVQRYLSADDEAYIASDLMRDEIQIGIVGVAEVGGTYFYSGYNRTKIISRDSIAQLVDFWRTFGPRQMIGDEIGISVSGDYTFDFTAGKYMSIGSGDDNDPHRFDAAALEVGTGPFDVTVQYRDGSGGRTSVTTNTGTGGIVLTPSTPSTAFWKYHDDGTGTLAAMGDEEWGVHLMYSLPTVIYFGGAELEFGLPILQISQVKFSDDIFKLSPRTGIISAIQTHDTHAFLRGTGPFIGAVAVRGDCTGLSSDPTKVELVSGTLDQIQGEISAGQLNFQATASMPGALYVDAATGDDATADGTMNLPYATIGAAVAALGANEEVVVNPGVYTENVVVGAGSEDIRISARIPRTVTWRGEASWTGGGGVLFDHTAAEAVNIRIEDIDFALAVNAVRTVSTGQVRVLGCTFTNIGWSGSGLSLQNPDDNAGTLGYDSDSADLVTYAASANVAAGWCVDIDGAAYASVNDCQFTYVYGSYHIMNASQGFTAHNNSKHVYGTAYKVGNSERVREHANYAGHVGQSCYYAHDNLLCTISRSIGEGSWGPAAVLDSNGDQVLRDIQFVDSRLGDFTSAGVASLAGAVHITGDTQPDSPLFAVSISDAEIVRSSVSPVLCSGIYFDASVNSLPSRSRALFSIDDVTVRSYTHGVNLGETDGNSVRITLGDMQFTDIGTSNIVPPQDGNYYELPFSNHLTNANELDFSLDPLENTIIVKEGVAGPVLNKYPVNGLSATAGPPMQILLAGSEKIQFDQVAREGVSIDGTAITATNDIDAANQLNALFARLPEAVVTPPAEPSLDGGVDAESVADQNYNSSYMADLVGDLFGATTTGSNHGTWHSSETIDANGEYFDFLVDARSKRYMVGLTTPALIPSLGTGSGSEHTGILWSLAIYEGSLGYPWTFYGSRAQYSYNGTFFGNSGRFQYHAGLTDAVGGSATGNTVVRWKIGIEDGYVKAWFYSVVDSEWKYVAKSSYVLDQDDYSLVVKFRNQGGGLVEYNQATDPDLQVDVYRHIDNTATIGTSDVTLLGTATGTLGAGGIVVPTASGLNDGFVSNGTINQVGQFFELSGFTGNCRLGLLQVEDFETVTGSSDVTTIDDADRTEDYGYFIGIPRNGDNGGLNQGNLMRWETGTGWSYNTTTAEDNLEAGGRMRVGIDNGGHFFIQASDGAGGWQNPTVVSRVGVPTGTTYKLLWKGSTDGASVADLSTGQLSSAPALTFYFINSFSAYYFPLFATAEEAEWVDENLTTLWPSGGYTDATTGAAASYTFGDDSVPGRTWYMPQTLSTANYFHMAPPTSSDLPESGQYSWTQITDTDQRAQVSDQSITADEGSTLNYQIALDAGSPTVNQYVAASTLPAGISLNGSTGVLSGTFPAHAGGTTDPTYTIINLIAHNSDGGTSFSVTIGSNPAAVTPVSGAHWYSDSTALVGANTLDDGSLVAVDDLVTEGKRWYMTRTEAATNLGDVSGWTAVAGSTPTTGEEQVIYGFLRKAAAAPYTILDFELGVQFFEHSTEPQYRLFTSDGATVTQRGLLTGASPATTFSIADLFFEVNANHSAIRAALVTDPTDNVATTPYDELASTTVYEMAVDFPHSTITAVDGAPPTWIEVADGTGFAVGDHIHIVDTDETAIIDSITAGGIRLGFASSLSAVPTIGTEVEVYSEVGFLALNRTTDILSLGAEGAAPQALVSHEYHIVEDTFGLPLFNGHTGGDLTLNAGQTYRFWLDHDSIESTDSLGFVLASDNSAYTTGVTTVGTPGTAGAYVEFAIPQDVPPVKFKWTSGGVDGYSAPTISGSTYSVGITGITLEGPAANQTGTEIVSSGHGWVSLDEQLHAGERLVLPNAFFADLVDEATANYEVTIGLKGDTWANTKKTDGSNQLNTGMYKGDHYLRIYYAGSSVYYQIFSPAGASNQMLTNTPALHDTVCAFLELDSAGDNIRIGFGRNGNIGVVVGDESSVIYSDWASYKKETGDQGFGISSIDVMILVNNVFSASTFDGAAIDWTELSEVATPAAPATLTAMDHAMTFTGGSKYQRQGVSVSSTAHPMMMNGLGVTTAAPLTSGHTSNDTNAHPWACAIMFRPTVAASNQHVWNLGEGTATGSDNIYLRLSAGKELYFGWGREGGYNECYIGNLSTVVNSGHWIGVYIAHNGTRWSGTNATAANLSDTFDVRYMTSVAWSQQDASSQWSLSQSNTGFRMDRTFSGSLTFGGRGSNRSYNGYIAHAMVTTLRRNQPMPDLTESEMMMMYPADWLATYRDGQTYRLTSGSEGTFALGTTNSANATQVWLEGDGAGDAYNAVYNQVYPAHTNTRLVGSSLVSTDLANITDPRP